jgi:predicted Rossmann fold nucleotide-binding protein DprA/Smf involved in DNA uptake
VPGIDLAAHLGALDNPGSTTFAVLANPAGGGLRGHEWTSRSTQQAIVAGGGFLSEYEEFVPFGSDEHRERLLQRDRIISGLSDCFVAFECSSGSATVDTAKRALAQGKPVVCVVPPRRTERRGTDELAGDPRVTVLSSADGSADKIAFAVHELIGSTRHRSRIVGTAGG